MLAVPFLVAGHAVVHPVDGGIHIVSHIHTNANDDVDHHDQDCGLCDFIKAVGQTFSNVPPVYAVILATAFVAYSGMKQTIAVQRLGASAYLSQGPPARLS